MNRNNLVIIVGLATILLMSASAFFVSAPAHAGESVPELPPVPEHIAKFLQREKILVGTDVDVDYLHPHVVMYYITRDGDKHILFAVRVLALIEEDGSLRYGEPSNQYNILEARRWRIGAPPEAWYNIPLLEFLSGPRQESPPEDPEIPNERPEGKITL